MKVKYEELGKMQTTKKDIVISQSSKGNFVIGQKFKLHDGNRDLSFFAKGALHLNDVEEIKQLSILLNDIYNTLTSNNKVESNF